MTANERIDRAVTKLDGVPADDRDARVADLLEELIALRRCSVAAAARMSSALEELDDGHATAVRRWGW